MSAYVCFCEHPQSQHKRGRDGCRAVDCGCAKFQADLKASAALQGVTQATVPAEDATIVPMSLDRDLAELEASDPHVRVAGERLDRAIASIVESARPKTHLESVKAQLAKAERERDAAIADADRCEDANIKHMEERDLARAELASARTELEHLRRAFNPNTEGAPPA